MANFILTEEYKANLSQRNPSVLGIPQGSSRKKYNIISNELRKKIIDRLSSNSIPLKQVSKEFNIKLSTCKAIMHVFQKEGRFEKKKKRIRKPKFQAKGPILNPNDQSLSWLIFPDLETFLNRFPKLRVLFEKKPQKPTLEEEITEETHSDILTTTSNMPEKTPKNRNSMPKCLDFQENETNASFFSEENGKNDTLVVLRNMWEKVYEHFGA